MVTIPFCGQTYTDKTLNANAQSCINFYPMLSPTPTEPSRIILYPTPGFKLFQDIRYFINLFNPTWGLIGQACRGFLTINDALYVVLGNTFLKLDSTSLLGFTLIAKLSSSTGRVSISCNTLEIIITDDTNGYVYNLSTAAFANIGGGSWPTAGVTNVTYIDSYILAAENNSKKVIQSDSLAGGTYSAQAFAIVTSFPDNLVAVYSDQLQVYIFGSKVTEVRFNSAATPFAFEKRAGVLIQAGCAAKHTIINVAGTFIWLAADAAGKPYVAALAGYNTKVLSTPPMNEAIERYTTTSDAFSYTYREGDNQFYSITFPTARVTWVLDLKMNMWHQRSYNGGEDLPTCYAMWQGNHVVGTADGKIFYMSQDFSQADFGPYEPIDDQFPAVGAPPTHYPPIRTRTAPHITAGGKFINLDELEIFFEAGVGINNTSLVDVPANLVTPISDPQATLEISRDGGHTWRNVGTKSMGKIGEYKKRLVWTRLGRGRSITPRLTISDPVRTYILGAEAKVRVSSK